MRPNLKNKLFLFFILLIPYESSFAFFGVPDYEMHLDFYEGHETLSIGRIFDKERETHSIYFQKRGSTNNKFIFNDVIVHVDDESRISGIEITGKKLTTRSDLQIGDSFSKVLEKYFKNNATAHADYKEQRPFNISSNQHSFVYTIVGSWNIMVFYITHDKISKIVMYKHKDVISFVDYNTLHFDSDFTASASASASSTILELDMSLNFNAPTITESNPLEVIYQGFNLYMDNQGKLQAFELKTDLFSTSKKIKIGSNISEVLEAYGEAKLEKDFVRMGPYDNSFDNYDYYIIYDKDFNKKNIVFYFMNGRVSRILFYKGIDEC